MKTLVTVLSIISVVSVYFLARLLAWDIWVAGPYMEATFLKARCDRYEAAHTNNELAFKNNLEPVACICSIDEASCEESRKMFEDYEVTRAQYHKWFPFY